MCRHLAYLGPPVALSRLLFEPPHALAHQAWAPRDMRGGGTINADGFGVGWYPPAGAPLAGAPLAGGPLAGGPPAGGPPAGGPPRRYRRDRPLWADPDLPRLAADITAPAVLAAVRSATPGMGFGAAACAPFAGGGMLFSLNGRVTGWPDSVAKLAERLPVTQLLTMAAPTDSVLLWALVRQRLAAGEPAAAAVAATVAEVAAAAPASRLNLLLTDGRTIVATTRTHSLSVRRDERSVLVSSEPLDDDPAWRPVPDGSLVVATPAAVDVSPLPEGP